MVENFPKLKLLVEHVLDKFPETRSSDTLLCIRAVQELGGRRIQDLEKINIVSVHKLRQAIQNKEGNYLPSEGVQEERRKLDRRIRSYFRNQKSANI